MHMAQCRTSRQYKMQRYPRCTARILPTHGTWLRPQAKVSGPAAPLKPTIMWDPFFGSLRSSQLAALCTMALTV